MIPSFVPKLYLLTPTFFPEIESFTFELAFPFLKFFHISHLSCFYLQRLNKVGMSHDTHS